MMKSIILNDLHFGCRNENAFIAYWQERFFEEILFPYMKTEKIKHIVCLGDVFDRRKYINFNTLKFFNEKFLDVCRNNDISIDFILGNHDIYHKNTNKVNAPKEILNRLSKDYKVRIFENTQEVYLGETKVLYCPWINSENEEETFKILNDTDCKIVFGHFELVGFDYAKGIQSTHGHKKEILSKFDAVYTGHYHTKSSKDNIHYLGSQYQMTWADYSDKKYFHVFDDETLEIVSVENPLSVFEKIYYNDENEDILKVNYETFNKKFVRVIVANKTDDILYNRFLEEFSKIDTASFSVVEETLVVSESQEEFKETEQTKDLIENYVNTIESDSIDKKDLLSFLLTLYVEAESIV